MRIAVVADAPLEATYVLARDDAIAMDADKARAEFVFEPRQRFFEQKLALAGADRDVFQLSF